MAGETNGPTGYEAILQDLERGHEPLSLARAAKESCVRRNGRPPHPATLYRWAEFGHKGVKLEVAIVGDGMVTTRPALLRFIARRSASASVSVATPPSTPRPAHETAESILNAAGI